MKNLFHFFLFDPFWLTRRLTFCWIFPAIMGIASIGTSLWGQSKQEKANKQATDAHNQTLRDLNRENNQYGAESARLQNQRTLSNYAKDSGRMGGIESDVARARNMFHRNRLATTGYLPKLNHDDPQVQEAFKHMGKGSSAQDLYEFMDDAAFARYVDSLQLDHKFAFEDDLGLIPEMAGGPPEIKTGGLWGKSPQMAMDQYWTDTVEARKERQTKEAEQSRNSFSNFRGNPFGYWRGRAGE